MTFAAPHESQHYAHLRSQGAVRRFPSYDNGGGPRCWMSDLVGHSITSLAVASSDAGTVKPSALAVLTLTTSVNFVGSWIGRSAGLSPLRMRST